MVRVRGRARLAQVMESYKRLQAFLQILADANRLRIIAALGGERRSVSDIVGVLGVSQPLVSHHLRTLKEAGILAAERRGPFVFYWVRDPRLLGVLETMHGMIPDETREEGGFRVPPFRGGMPPWGSV